MRFRLPEPPLYPDKGGSNVRCRVPHAPLNSVGGSSEAGGLYMTEESDNEDIECVPEMDAGGSDSDTSDVSDQHHSNASSGGHPEISESAVEETGSSDVSAHSRQGRRNAFSGGFAAVPESAIAEAGAFGSYRFQSKQATPAYSLPADPRDDPQMNPGLRPEIPQPAVEPRPIVGWRLDNPRYVEYRLSGAIEGSSERWIRVENLRSHRMLMRYFGALPDRRLSPYERCIVESELEYAKYIMYRVSDYSSDETAWCYADELGPEWDDAICSFYAALAAKKMRRLDETIVRQTLSIPDIEDFGMDAAGRSVSASGEGRRRPF
ncbi:hypothetical protein MBLNU459_g3438t1 [Dothideomycetes sp. NU459]